MMCPLRRVNIISTWTESCCCDSDSTFFFICPCLLKWIKLISLLLLPHSLSRSNTVALGKYHYGDSIPFQKDETKSILLTSLSVLPLTRRSCPSLMTLASSSLIGTSGDEVNWMLAVLVWKNTRLASCYLYLSESCYRGSSSRCRCCRRSCCCRPLE